MKSLTLSESRSYTNEFIIIAFCYERAGLVAVKLEVLHTYCQNGDVADQKLMELQLSGEKKGSG